MSFYFSATPVFTPQTYEEMVKPLDKYNEAYEKVESQLVDLQDKTQYWADRVQDSPVAKQMYEYYNNKLQQLSDDFAKGMTSGNRAKLIEMHRDYSKTMGALENQWKAKEAFIKERKDKGNDYIYGVYDNPNYVEGGDEPAYLDEVNMDMFANGRTPTTRGLNLDDYQKKVSTDIAALSESVDDTLGKQIETDDGQMILRNIKSGQLTMEDVDKIGAIMNGIANGVEFDPKSDKDKIYYYYAKTLADHFKDTPYKYMSEENQSKIMHSTIRGLFAGLQKTEGKLYNDAEFLSAKDKWNQWVQKRQLEIQEAKASDPLGLGTGTVTGNGKTVNLGTKETSNGKRTLIMNGSKAIVLDEEGNPTAWTSVGTNKKPILNDAGEIQLVDLSPSEQKRKADTKAQEAFDIGIKIANNEPVQSSELDDVIYTDKGNQQEVINEIKQGTLKLISVTDLTTNSAKQGKKRNGKNIQKSDEQVIKDSKINGDKTLIEATDDSGSTVKIVISNHTLEAIKKAQEVNNQNTGNGNPNLNVSSTRTFNRE